VYDITLHEMIMRKPSLVTRAAMTHPLHVLGCQVRFLCEAPDTAGSFSMMEVTLPQGAGPPPHHHDWDEAYYIADGRVQFTLGDRTIAAERGDFLYAPGGTVHGFSGSGESPARVLILDAPAHAAGFFREVDREVRSMRADAAKVPQIGERHGIHFLPPQAVT
jgi:quercetin dioxygenase-like cupin family protein